jgi:hypothetical protein
MLDLKKFFRVRIERLKKAIVDRVNAFFYPFSRVGWRTYAIIGFTGVVVWLLMTDYALHRTLWIAPHSPSVLGFQRINPQVGDVSLAYDGTFNAAFKNDIGEPIRLYVDTAKVWGINKTDGLCRSWSISPREVKAGMVFTLTGHGCPKGNPGELYNMKAIVPCSIVIDDDIINYFEEGSIRGIYD